MLKIDDNEVAEAEAHELAGSASFNDNVNVLKNQTKIRKKNFQLESTFGNNHILLASLIWWENTSLVCCIHGVKKRH